MQGCRRQQAPSDKLSSQSSLTVFHTAHYFKTRRRKRLAPEAKMISFNRSFTSTKMSLVVVCSCLLAGLSLGKIVAGETNGATGGQAVKITVQPNDLIAIEGESAELNCDAEGSPEPTIEWYHNGQLIRSSTNLRTTMGGSIQFLSLRPNTTQEGQQSDAGVYHCLAKNQFGQARSQNATLQVAYIKEQFKAAPRDKVVAVGDAATFDCMPQAWPEPRIHWRHNGRLIQPEAGAKYTIGRIARADLEAAGRPAPNGPETFVKDGEGSPAGTSGQPEPATSGLVDVFGSRLVIRQADKGDEGDYSCLVETKGSHRLIERESPAGRLTAYVKPYFTEAPQHRSAQVGDQVRIRCRMGGEPEPVISWRRQNGQPLSEKTMIEPADKTLVIDGLRLSDQGVYICEGENAVGSARALAQVSVSSRPKFSQQPADQSAEIGSQVQLKCAGDASPPPMLFWYKEGHRQLMFPPPAPGPSSQGKPQQSPWNQPNPFSMPSTSDTSPAINRLFSMPIGSEHLPSNNYFGNRIYVDSQGTLNIVNVTYGDSGYWACALVSSVGSVMAKAKLTVKQSAFGLVSDQYGNIQDPLRARAGGLSSVSGKFDLLPPPVIKMGSSNQTLPTNTSVTLLCEVVSQVAYKIQWFFDSQLLQEEPPRLTVLENGNLYINNLRISDTGLYTCVVTAAEDPNMPVAHPFEPLEASMLTSAPPTYQSTAHSCMLKVAAPTTFHIQLFKEDTYAYPSSPGAPYMVAENGPDAITIAWAPPGDSGKLPVKQYVVEHYDTSEENSGWRVIHRPNGKESLLIGGLSPDGSHFFVVRATNGRGTGPSSAIAGPMRTQSGQFHYQQEQQRLRSPTGLDFAETRPDASLARDRLMTVSTNLLSLTPVECCSIKLQWATNGAGNSSYLPFNSLALGDFLEGYSVRYRAVGIGESLLSKDPLFGLGTKNQFEPIPSSLPLVTSYVEDEETISVAHRVRRSAGNYYDFTTEFNEVKVTDHNADHFTIKDLRPFTTYQFFVVPYYKEIDGVPSNILTAQTNEDRPDVAPSIFDIKPLDNTSVKMIWSHIPPVYAHGIIRGYMIRINQSDVRGPSPLMSVTSKVMTEPMSSLLVAPVSSIWPESKIQPVVNGIRQFVVMYDIANLTHKSFYSLEVVGLTSVGVGPWSEARNIVMDPEEMANFYKSNGDNELSDLGSGSFLSRIPNSLDNRQGLQGYSSLFVVLPVALIISILLLVAGFVLYRRNNQQVITWKKTISEHFTNKFYLPSAVDHDHHRGPGSLQQNIYDHQHHLIYSAGSTHMAHQPIAANQTMWTGVTNGSGCVNSSGTGSLSSHGGLLPISSDPNSTRIRGNTDQVLIMSHNKDINSRYVRGGNGPVCQVPGDHSRLMDQHKTMQGGGDYYSVMNNVAEYEELDQQQRHQAMQIGPASFVERHQTGSSNSDTSCPSSVTRLLPNQTYNRGAPEQQQQQQQRHEMILQQQVGCNGEIKQPIITMINGNESGKFQNNMPLSPYATTNLMNQLSHQPQQAHIFANPQMNLVHQHRLLQQQQQFLTHAANSSMDDSSRMLMAQQMNGGQGPSTVQSFRTLQRHTAQLQPSVAHSQPTQLQQILMQNELPQFTNNQSVCVTSQPFQAHNNLVTNVTANPLAEAKSNFYEHIDYDGVQQQQPDKAKQPQDGAQFRQNQMITSPTSSGSVASSNQQYQADTNGKFRRYVENESHDLRVFASGNAPDAERQRLNAFDEAQNGNEDDDVAQVDETTAFRRQSGQNEELRTRQLSKRKKKQQRNRLHNENQQTG